MKTLKKSLWLESGKTVPLHIIQLFEDCGIENNHEILTHIGSMDSELLYIKIKNAEQICFESSLVGDSVKIIESLVSTLGYAGIRDKRFIVLADLLYALNSGYILSKAAKETTFFNNNEVYVMEDGKFQRIVYDYELKKYIYFNS